jgi:hypothetical protein
MPDEDARVLIFLPYFLRLLPSKLKKGQLERFSTVLNKRFLQNLCERFAVGSIFESSVLRLN